MVDVFENDKREVFETVCLVIFPFISLMKYQVSGLSEKGVKAVVLGPERSDTQTKGAFEGKYNLAIRKCKGTLLSGFSMQIADMI